MTLGRRLLWQWHDILGEFNGGSVMYYSRFYSSKIGSKKFRPTILKRIDNRAKDFRIRGVVPLAQEVLRARALLIRGVATLLQVFPICACKFCTEVYMSEKGHLIKSCCGYKRHGRNQVHEWVSGGLNDVLVQVETFHSQNMVQDVTKQNQRFEFDRIPAVVELCCKAGPHLYDEYLSSSVRSTYNVSGGVDGAKGLSPPDTRLIANGTLGAWETVRSGVTKLLKIYPSKVCKYCSEVQIGPFGRKAQLCRVFNSQSHHIAHFWEKAEVDDLVPPRIVWRRRPQDPPILLDEGQKFYGHAPAVVDLCAQAGASVPSHYFCMMKVQGLSSSPSSSSS